ncbi:thioesterase domain-containing protein [Streptomyces nogalater]
MALGGAHQYARLARHFEGRRDLLVPAMPGFGPGEPLPRSVDAVLETVVEGIRRACPDERPYVLVGYSSGASSPTRRPRSWRRPAGRPRAWCCWTPICPGTTARTSCGGRCSTACWPASPPSAASAPPASPR